MKPTRSLWLHRLLFLCKFIQSPRTVGSITPSSVFLTKEMMRHVEWTGSPTIVELGAGMGCFTSQIQKLKSPRSRILVFELEPGMRNYLQRSYPDFDFYADATTLSLAMQEQGLTQVDYILSGLPFSNFSQELRERNIDQVIDALKPGGVFITFQYSLQMRRYLMKRFHEVEIHLVSLNVPPAFVYCCIK